MNLDSRVSKPERCSKKTKINLGSVLTVLVLVAIFVPVGLYLSTKKASGNIGLQKLPTVTTKTRNLGNSY